MEMTHRIIREHFEHKIWPKQFNIEIDQFIFFAPSTFSSKAMNAKQFIFPNLILFGYPNIDHFSKDNNTWIEN